MRERCGRDVGDSGSSSITGFGKCVRNEQVTERGSRNVPVATDDDGTGRTREARTLALTHSRA